MFTKAIKCDINRLFYLAHLVALNFIINILFLKFKSKKFKIQNLIFKIRIPKLSKNENREEVFVY